MYWIMTKELVFLEIRDSDSCMTSFEVSMPINYESPSVRCVALPRLEVREYK